MSGVWNLLLHLSCTDARRRRNQHVGRPLQKRTGTWLSILSACAFSFWGVIWRKSAYILILYIHAQNKRATAIDTMPRHMFKWFYHTWSIWKKLHLISCWTCNYKYTHWTSLISVVFKKYISNNLIKLNIIIFLNHPSLAVQYSMVSAHQYKHLNLNSNIT